MGKSYQETPTEPTSPYSDVLCEEKSNRGIDTAGQEEDHDRSKGIPCKVELRQKEGYATVRVFETPHSDRVIGEIPSGTWVACAQVTPQYVQVLWPQAKDLPPVLGWVGFKNVSRKQLLLQHKEGQSAVRVFDLGAPSIHAVEVGQIPSGEWVNHWDSTP